MLDAACVVDEPQIKVVVESVRQASLLSREIRNGMVEMIRKEDRSPVTVADYAVQALIARFLKTHSPGVPLVAEENGAYLRTPEAAPVLEQVTSWVKRRVADATSEQILEWIDRGTSQPSDKFWTLDPIDGTKGFLRGNHYAVALALIERGVVLFSVIGCPTLDVGARRVEAVGTIAVAAKGRGAWRAALQGDPEWRRLQVSSKADVSQAILLQSLEAKHTDQSETGKVMQLLGITSPAIRMDSLAKFVVLAAGEGDILCRMPTADRPDYKENIWDQASGVLLVTEAGGAVSDLDGRPLDFSRGKKLIDNRGVLSTNGHLHQRFLAALRAS